MKLTTNRPTLMLAALAILIWTTACQTKTESSVANANAPAANSNAQAAANSPQPEAAKTETSKPAEVPSLATPTETYRTGFAARQKKDLATLKRVLSKDALKFLTEIGNVGQKTLDDQLRGLAESPQASSAETRNEKINGRRATLEYLTEDGKWEEMQFVKEGNDWKIDLPKA